MIPTRKCVWLSFATAAAVVAATGAVAGPALGATASTSYRVESVDSTGNQDLSWQSSAVGSQANTSLITRDGKSMLMTTDFGSVMVPAAVRGSKTGRVLLLVDRTSHASTVAAFDSDGTAHVFLSTEQRYAASADGHQVAYESQGVLYLSDTASSSGGLVQVSPDGSSVAAWYVSADGSHILWIDSGQVLHKFSSADTSSTTVGPINGLGSANDDLSEYFVPGLASYDGNGNSTSSDSLQTPSGSFVLPKDASDPGIDHESVQSRCISGDGSRIAFHTTAVQFYGGHDRDWVAQVTAKGLSNVQSIASGTTQCRMDRDGTHLIWPSSFYTVSVSSLTYSATAAPTESTSTFAWQGSGPAPVVGDLALSSNGMTASWTFTGIVQQSVPEAWGAVTAALPVTATTTPSPIPGTSTLPTPDPSPSATPPPPCGTAHPPLYFLTALGSGDHFTGTADINSDVLAYIAGTKKVEEFPGILELQRMEGRSAYAPMQPEVVDYPALGVEVLTQNLSTVPAYATKRHSVSALMDFYISRLASNTSRYLASADEGYTQLIKQFLALHQNCPSAGFLVSGYSQGAIAVHRFMNYLQSLDGPAQQSVRGVLLVADPARIAHSAVRNFADLYDHAAPDLDSAGVCALGPRLSAVLPTVRTACDPSGKSIPDIPASFRGRTVQLCDRDDLVCDTTDVLKDVKRSVAPCFALGGLIGTGACLYFKGPPIFQKAGSIHTNYGRTSGAMRVARLLATQIRNLPGS